MKFLNKDKIRPCPYTTLTHLTLILILLDLVFILNFGILYFLLH